MDVFRLIADFSHLLAVITLLVNIIRTKSCAGISGKSQILFAVVYTTRYFDLFYYFISIYNYVFKVLYVASTYITVSLIFIVFKKTYEGKNDRFFAELLVIPCFILAVWINHEFAPLELFWTFSIYLEAVAILPQFYMIQQKKQLDKNLLTYLLLLGMYRMLYLVHWVYRYYTELYFDLIADTAGLVYTVIYILAVSELVFGKVKVTSAEDAKFLEKNIFFISHNGSGYSNFINVPLDSEKDNPTEPILQKNTEESQSKLDV